MMRAFLLCLFFVPSSAIRVDSSEDEMREKPIQKVIRLLNEMQAQLQKEADDDEDMMDKLGCWCDTNEKEKTKALAINNQRVQDLGAAIEEFTAKSAQLKVDLENLDKQVAQTSKSLDEATAIREKDSAEFFDGEKDSIQNIGAIKGAILTLGKVHGESLSQEALVQVKQVLSHHMKNHHHGLLRALSSSQHRMVISLLQQEPMDADLQKAFLQEEGKAPQSGAIFGIMKQMKEQMETDVASAQKDEETAKSDFTDMKSSKTSELNSAKELIDSKKVLLAETDQKNADSKADLEDTEATIEADTNFMTALKDKCSNASAEYAARSKVRNEELQACSETIGILTDDDAKDLLQGFVQLSSRTTRVNSRSRAARFLTDASQRLHRPKLAALAMSVRLDAFTKVKENIDNVIAALKKEQKDEVVQKDFCVKEFHENEMQTTETTNLKEDLTNTIADLETSKTTLADEIKTLQAEVAQTQVDMKVASENRKKQNKEFQLTVTDQQATRAILKKALDRLKSFYSKSFLQTGASHRQPGYKKNSGASSIMSMIGNIIEESSEVEKDALAAENDAQAAYEALVKDSNDSIAAMQKSVVDKTEELAQVDGKKAQATADLQQAETSLLKLAKYNMELHTSCDFLVKYFDIRQEKRGEEIEALQQAKAIFSGANFGR